MMFRTISLTIMLLCATAIAQAQFPIDNAFPALGFSRPVDLQNAGDGSDRLFVVEQSGRILVFENRADVATSLVYLDIRDRVNDAGNEEGLLGLAFHPDYANNGYFFVNYSATNPRRNVIARYRVSSGDPNVAEKDSEKIILTFEQPYSNHNGGQLAFGPDDFLYIATGDGGSGGDPQNNAQNRSNLLGKILRIDIDNTAGERAYAIPNDNPFAGNASGFAEEIYAYGLRNPWRFSFDPVTGRLWTGDVGQNRYEEVDIIENGKNYGWRVMEGFSCYNPSSGCDQTGLIKPIVEYGRDQGASITGGHVYRGASVPELQGQYIYADFVTGRIWGLTYNGPGDVDNQLLLASSQNVSSFGIDESGELYICSFGGGVYRFRPSVTSTADAGSPLPEEITLSSSYPNPVSLATVQSVSLRIALPMQQNLRVVLYDTLGKEIRTVAQGLYAAGIHRVQMNVGGLRPGVYYYTLETGRARQARKLLVME